MSSRRAIPTVLSIAGSDSGGGAGIQADLKAFARAGAHGMTAITAITAQSTTGVDSVHHVPAASIVDQVRAVTADIGVDAIKTGMLGTRETIDAVVEALRYAPDAPLVVDPVMVAESGAVLLDSSGRSALVERLLPLATVATPNLLEARELGGLDEHASREQLARAVHALGPRAVVVTGGHSDDATDVLVDEHGEVTRIEGPRHPGGASHGAGCTHSATLAAALAGGASIVAAARQAKQVTSDAVARGIRDLGHGAGPVDVFGLGRPERGAAR